MAWVCLPSAQATGIHLYPSSLETEIQMTQVHYNAPAAAQQEIPKVHYMARVPAGTPGTQAADSTADLVSRAREAVRELFLGPRDADVRQTRRDTVHNADAADSSDAAGS